MRLFINNCMFASHCRCFNKFWDCEEYKARSDVDGPANELREYWHASRKNEWVFTARIFKYLAQASPNFMWFTVILFLSWLIHLFKQQNSVFCFPNQPSKTSNPNHNGTTRKRADLASAKREGSTTRLASKHAAFGEHGSERDCLEAFSEWGREQMASYCSGEACWNSARLTLFAQNKSPCADAITKSNSEPVLWCEK